MHPTAHALLIGLNHGVRGVCVLRPAGPRRRAASALRERCQHSSGKRPQLMQVSPLPPSLDNLFFRYTTQNGTKVPMVFVAFEGTSAGVSGGMAAYEVVGQ